jgi:dynein heavy chain
VQPHLKKVFENIHAIEFDSNNKIHAMFSAEKERIPFVKMIDPVKKPVEDWMGEVEKMMKNSIRHQMH